MKIAITAQGPEMSSQVDPRFGRARYFVIYDTDSDSFEAVDNQQNLNAAQGAGVQAAQNVARYQVQALVSGNCGPKAFQVLSAVGVGIYAGAEGTVQEAIRKFQAGELQKIDTANVQGHWM